MNSDLLIVAATVNICLIMGLSLFVGMSVASSAIKISFAFLCTALSGWAIANVLADVDLSGALIWTRLSFAMAATSLTALAIFVMWFPRRLHGAAIASFGAFAVGGVVVSVCFSDVFIPSVTVVENYANVVAGTGYWAYVSFAVAAALFSVGILFYRLQKESDMNRQRVQFMLYGTAITVTIALLTNLLIPLLTGTNPYAIYGSFSSLALVGLVAYSIIKHQLFSIRVATARAVAYLLSGMSLGLLFATIIYSFANTVFSNTPTDSAQQAFYTLSAVLVGFTFPGIKSFFDRFTRRVFLRDVYETEAVLKNIASIVSSTKNSDALLKKTSQEVYSQMYLSFVEAYLFEGGVWKRRAKSGMAQNTNNIMDISELVAVSDSAVISLEEGGDTLPHREDIALIVILRTNQNVLGYLTVGFKQNGTAFTEEDKSVFEAIGTEVGIALENYLRYEAIEQFNETLKQKVENATGELRMSNKKLKELDASKDEFISMASHQLRTPLTSIKGYLSMVLEGDLGDITPDQKKVLEEAFNSSQRMVFLIGDFLNVSRIQTGKFELEKTDVDLPFMISDEIEQLKASAKSRSIDLVYDPPDSFPLLKLDENKIRQVMMNFIDNAIFYARPEGGKIVVTLAKRSDYIVFKVTDNGIGVPKNERHQLFSKFYRASNAKKARPDGTGIGLFMAKKVIIAHSGAILFESTEGKGSTFGFRLPLTPLKDESKKLNDQPA